MNKRNRNGKITIAIGVLFLLLANDKRHPACFGYVDNTGDIIITSMLIISIGMGIGMGMILFSKKSLYKSNQS